MNNEIKLVSVTQEHTDFILKLNNSDLGLKSFYRTISREQHLVFLEKTKNDRYYLVLVGEVPAGTVSIYNIDLENKKAEWGRFILLPKFFTVGFLVAKMIQQIAFQELDLHKLYCWCFSTNTNIIAFNKALGFTEEGHFIDHFWRDGKYHDIQYFAKFKK